MTFLTIKLLSENEGVGKGMSDKGIPLSEWAGRWDEFFKSQHNQRPVLAQPPVKKVDDKAAITI
jgi:hypothetical protein